MLKTRRATVKSAWAFPGETDEAAFLVSSLDHQHDDVRTALKMPTDFVIHSLRHTMLTRLGEAGADAFSIMRIAGHSSVTVSQRYVFPTPEGMDRAFDRLESLNAEKFEQAKAEAKEGYRRVGYPHKNPHSPKTPLQIIHASRCI
jgi:integrase